MSKRLALGFLAAASLLICVLHLVGGRAAEVLFALLATAFPVALMALGASRRGRLGRRALPLLSLVVLLELCVVGMLVFAGGAGGDALVLGLPPAAALLLYGVFLLPLALVSLGYALTFDETAVDAADLEKLNRLAASHREKG